MPMYGAREVVAALEKAAKAADMAAKVSVVEAGALVTSKAKANFEGSHKRGKPHVGGDKPNVVSGDLRRSIRPTTVVRLGLADYSSAVGPTMIYGRRVELGYRGSRGYPYFSPAASDAASEFRALGAKNWNTFLRRI